jgi:DNA-binding CsgD family transcriptional regulator
MKSLLSNGCIEFFRNPDSSNVFFVKNGQVHPFSEISLDDAEALRDDLELYPAKIRAIEKAGIVEPLKQLEVYAGCVFGAFDSEPDFIACKRTGYEYSPCSIRGMGTCPFKEIICDKGRFIMKDMELSRRQVEVLSKIREDLSDNEAADKLFISPQTLKRHAQNIRLKTGIRSSRGLAVFATQHRI